ncbi:unnamed protein product [Rotaria sp. Silwood1]|nr:unnamed protein product [Rotaria sp. Silwood1]
MHTVFIALICFLPYITAHHSTILHSKYRWLRLPATPKLPYPCIGKYATINSLQIWYTICGPKDAEPILFLNGGLVTSDYGGFQVQELKSFYRCVWMDSRGQGRSFPVPTNITYDLMMSDVIAFLNYLNIKRVHLVGWTDGAMIGLNLAMNHPNRLLSLFAFAANYVPSGLKDTSTSLVFNIFLERVQAEYGAINQASGYSNLLNILTVMWATLPTWTQQDFQRISETLPIWIVDADHSEVNFRSQPNDMFSWIPQSSELILPGTSHFAFMQDPVGFTTMVKRFLAEVHCPGCP